MKGKIVINIEWLGWVATAILLIGYYLNAKKYTCSFIVWLAGNALMAVYAYLIQSFSVVFLSIILIGLNIYGYVNWKKSQ